MAAGDADRGGVIIELIRCGTTVRVSAIDPASLVEVVLQGPASAGETALRHAVLRKLERALSRRARPGASALARQRRLL